VAAGGHSRNSLALGRDVFASSGYRIRHVRLDELVVVATPPAEGLKSKEQKAFRV
jgi:hypothetical protein